MNRCYGCQADVTEDNSQCASCQNTWCADCVEELGAVFMYGTETHCNACRNSEKPDVPTRTLLDHLLTTYDLTYTEVVRDFRRKNPKYARSAYLWECTEEHDHDCSFQCKTVAKNFWPADKQLPIKGLCCKIKHPTKKQRWCSTCVLSSLQKGEKRSREEEEEKAE